MQLLQTEDQMLICCTCAVFPASMCALSERARSLYLKTVLKGPLLKPAGHTEHLMSLEQSTECDGIVWVAATGKQCIIVIYVRCAGWAGALRVVGVHAGILAVRNILVDLHEDGEHSLPHCLALLDQR